VVPFAVLIPCAVPEGHEGLGLGLAALFLALTRAHDRALALAQLFAGPDGKAVEAQISFEAWKGIDAPSAGHAEHLREGPGRAEDKVAAVLTGTLDPPKDGCSGSLHLVVFEGASGARVLLHQERIDTEDAGASVERALAEAMRAINAWTGRSVFETSAGALAGLDWEALESVLLAERCELNDPRRNGPYDRASALVHFERAADDAPTATYPRERLAVVARHAAHVSKDARADEAVLRTVTRALGATPQHVGLQDAALTLEVKRGAMADAEVRARALLERGSATPITHAMFAEVLIARGDWALAVQSLRTSLKSTGSDSSAYFRLADVSLAHGDAPTGSWLVDCALGWPGASEQHLQVAVKLIMSLEPDGVHRASRMEKLGERLMQYNARDPRPSLLRARALAQMGDREAALLHLDRVDELAPESQWAAEASVGRFHLDHPEDAFELEALMRACVDAPLADMPTIAIRAQRFAMLHEQLWLAHYALALAEMRDQRWASARRSLEEARTLSPGATAATRELARCYLELQEPARAFELAKHASERDPHDASMCALAADAAHALGNDVAAVQLAQQALSLEPANEAYKALVLRVGEPKQPGRSWRETLRSWGSSWGRT
jgi:tetratricopeptide (TPR) repeat protein